METEAAKCELHWAPKGHRNCYSGKSLKKRLLLQDLLLTWQRIIGLNSRGDQIVSCCEAVYIIIWRKHISVRFRFWNQWIVNYTERSRIWKERDNVYKYCQQKNKWGVSPMIWYLQTCSWRETDGIGSLIWLTSQLVNIHGRHTHQHTHVNERERERDRVWSPSPPFPLSILHDAEGQRSCEYVNYLLQLTLWNRQPCSVALLAGDIPKTEVKSSGRGRGGGGPLPSIPASSCTWRRVAVRTRCM